MDFGKKKTACSKYCKRLVFKLSCQGSNLNSSDSESDVLPITPQDNGGAKLVFFLTQ
jgi:hypothetical protein